MKRKTVVFLLGFFLFALTGCSGKKWTEDMVFTLNYKEQQITGTYTGDIRSGLPDGTGTFRSDETAPMKLEYEGQWEKGMLKGAGELFCDQFHVHYVDADRIGTYEGQAVDGVASGYGTFRAQNNMYDWYTYEGEWENDIFNGKGKMEYDDPFYKLREGTYVNGEFLPTAEEFYACYGTFALLEFHPSEKAREFLKEHENLFPADTEKEAADCTDEKILYQELAADPEQYGDKLFSSREFTVLQIIEETPVWGRTITSCIFTVPGEEETFAYCIYLDNLDHLKEGDTVTFYGLPLGTTSYLDQRGERIASYMFAGVWIS
ncbi:hypothetical protein [Anaerolentibacter hominis]|uniref:hypothetical protein n=1 Tax=Anaerolentibacter hominis TaxID=3079009 RepID=UPI0031B7F384